MRTRIKVEAERKTGAKTMRRVRRRRRCGAFAETKTMRRVQVLVRRQVRRRCGVFAETKTMRDDAARVRRRRRCGVCGDEDEDDGVRRRTKPPSTEYVQTRRTLEIRETNSRLTKSGFKSLAQVAEGTRSRSSGAIGRPQMVIHQSTANPSLAGLHDRIEPQSGAA